MWPSLTNTRWRVIHIVERAQGLTPFIPHHTSPPLHGNTRYTHIHSHPSPHRNPMQYATTCKYSNGTTYGHKEGKWEGTQVVCCMGMGKHVGNRWVFPRVWVWIQIFWPSKNSYLWLWVWVQVTSQSHICLAITLWPKHCHNYVTTTTTSEWAHPMFVSHWHPPHHTTSHPNWTWQWHVIHHHMTTPKGTPVSAVKWQRHSFTNNINM